MNEFYHFKFSYMEHLEMLIVLRIRFLLMSYDIDGMSLVTVR